MIQVTRRQNYNETNIKFNNVWIGWLDTKQNSYV